VPAVEPSCEGSQEPLHSDDEVWLWGLNHEMEMIPHETEGVDLPVGLGAGLPQGLDEAVSILVIAYDRFPPIPAIHHVVHRSFKFDP